MDYSVTKGLIEKGTVLPKKDIEYLGKQITEIQANWEKRQMFRTETEMRISVLNDIKFPTPASKYWQCVREQAVFYENLVRLSFDYRRNDIEQKKLLKEIEAEQDDLEKELLQIDLEEKQFGQLNMKQTAKDRMREIKLWAQIMAELVKQADFDTENVNTHQLVSYAHRFDRQMQQLDKSNASPSEMNNLIGQYRTAFRHLQEKGQLLKQADGRMAILEKPGTPSEENIHALRTSN